MLAGVLLIVIGIVSMVVSDVWQLGAGIAALGAIMMIARYKRLRKEYREDTRKQLERAEQRYNERYPPKE